MIHSSDNYNNLPNGRCLKDYRICYAIRKVRRIMDRYVRGHNLKDNVMISASFEDIMNLLGNIENAECQKGKDIIKEEIGEIIQQVEKNNNPNDSKYWENLKRNLCVKFLLVLRLK